MKPISSPSEFNANLIALANWLIKRANGEHDEATTRSMLRRKVDAMMSLANISVGSAPFLSALRTFEESVYDRHDDFLDRFAKAQAFALTQLAVNSENVHLVYVLKSGQHIADTVKLADVVEWLSNEPANVEIPTWLEEKMEKRKLAELRKQEPK